MTSTKIKEWSAEKKWNPFNSDKLLAHVYRWRLIKRGCSIPQPVLVTIDPVNVCDLSCLWCNSSHILQKRHEMIDGDTLFDIVEGLAKWQGSPDWPRGVESVCIAGGGEPLLHPDIGRLIELCVKKGIEVGIVTNGVNIDKFIPQLALCTWVGVSVDAGSNRTFERFKGKALFGKICNNIKLLTDYASRNECTLGLNRMGNGVSYKYLLYNGNIHEVSIGAKMAKELGCKIFHLRPAGTPWDKIEGNRNVSYKEGVVEQLNEQIESARRLEDESFSVYGVTHKFDDELKVANNFKTCHAIFMTAVFMPPRDTDKERYSLSTCCDRRGDTRLEFKEQIIDFDQVKRLWGSEEHWRIFDSIRLEDCPRCTYQPHNKIFEHVILNDSMTFRFI